MLRSLLVVVFALMIPHISKAGETAVKAGFERWNTTHVDWHTFTDVSWDFVEGIQREDIWRIVDIEQHGGWDLGTKDPEVNRFSGIMVKNEGIYKSDWALLVDYPEDVRNWCEKHGYRPFDVEHIWCKGDHWASDYMIAIVVRNSGNQYTPYWDFGFQHGFDNFAKVASDMASQRLIDVEFAYAGIAPQHGTYSWISVSNEGDQYVPTMPGFWFNYTADEYFTAVENGWQAIDVEIANAPTDTGNKAFVGLFVQTKSRSDFMPDHSTAELFAESSPLLNRSLRHVDLDLQSPWMVTNLRTNE